MSSARSGSRGSGAELVVDASAIVKAALVEDGVEIYAGRTMIAPSLLWSEATAAIRQLEFRGEITEAEADAAISRALGAGVATHASRGLAREAVTLARRLGWAKTYDAEYVALARRRGATFVTVDARLASVAVQLVDVAVPEEL